VRTETGREINSIAEELIENLHRNMRPLFIGGEEGGLK